MISDCSLRSVYIGYGLQKNHNSFIIRMIQNVTQIKVSVTYGYKWLKNVTHNRTVTERKRLGYALTIDTSSN